MDLNKLNDKQKEAVRCIDGPLLIIAGAGSGKTSTMTHRIAYMIEQGISPYRILAVTFTNKAANEMRERIESLCGEIHGMWVMTFHAMCLRMLRKHAGVIGYDKNFVIYDTADQKTLVRNICKELNLDSKEFKPAYIASVISDKKEQGITPQEFAENAIGMKNKLLARAYQMYEKALRDNNAMDFDDLLLNTLRMFKADESVLLEYSDRFEYIMVDEYQDTNNIQYRLVKLLSQRHGNICVVGDDDQCIYEWRGADITNILNFEKDFKNAKLIKLEQNYRSKGNILAAAHSVISNNKGRKKKKLWTEKEAGEKITYFKAEDEKDEANFIAREINILKNGNLKYSDFAVLYRTNAQSRALEDVFARRGIPYRVLSGMRYYDRKEVKDMMSYMRLVLNPKDDLALRRIINEPKRGIGVKTLEKLFTLAGVRGQSLMESLWEDDVLDTLPKKAFEDVKKMARTIELCREEAHSLSVADIYDRLLVNTGYLSALESENTVESESRIENLMEFKSVIENYENESEEPSLEEFMEGLSLMSEVDNHDETQDAVVLMTMHSSKGLEFPVVFLPGMEDGLFPGARSFDSPEGMEEERRLCYVGMTRAKERLFLTSATRRMLYGRTEYQRESIFLREVDKRLLTGDAIFEKKRDSFLGDEFTGPGVSTGSFDGYMSSNKAGYKPFDSLSYSKAHTKKVAAGGDEFKPGDRVKHSKFGEGLVIEDDAKTISVIFDEVGLKKMAKGIAVLKKL